MTKSEIQIPRKDFIAVERSPPSLEHEIIIAVKKPNLQYLESILRKRGNPNNEKYQQWLTLEEIDEILADAKTSAEQVLKWCRQHPGLRVEFVTRRHDYIRVVAKIEQWEVLLQTEFYAHEDHSYDVDENNGDKTNSYYDFSYLSDWASGSQKSIFGSNSSTLYNISGKKKRRRTSTIPVFHRAPHYTIPLMLQPFVLGMINTVQTPPRLQSYQKGVHFKDKTEILTFQKQRLKHLSSTLHQSSQSSSQEHQRRNNIRGSEPISIDNLEVRILDEASPARVTIPFLNNYYNVTNEFFGDQRLSQAVFATSNEYFSTSDLSAFQNYYNLLEQEVLVKNGHSIPTCPAYGANDTIHCKEGNLDMQYLMGSAQNTTTVFWWVPASTLVNPFALWAVQVAGEIDPPSSHCISWGAIEVFQSSLIMTLFNTEAMILAARGVTIVVAAGDDGASNMLEDNCLSDLPSGISILPWSKIWNESYTGTGYFPNFPASSPYVTTVGATMGPEIGTVEVAAQSQLGGIITSGGGFSTFFPMPEWQQPTGKNYLKDYAPSRKGYNPNGRGYPDLSLIGVDYSVINGGVWTSSYGTSCVAPVLAGWVSLVNAERKRRGINTTIGWLNPTLYAVGFNQSQGLTNVFNISFQDITSGHNRCCHVSSSLQSPSCGRSGFDAICGWDPVTGWGSVSFPNFLAMFSSTNIAGTMIAANGTNSACSLLKHNEESASPSLSAILVYTVSILLLILLISSTLSYIVYIFRKRRASTMFRVHPDGYFLPPHQSEPAVTTATVMVLPVSSAATATVIAVEPLTESSTHPSSPFPPYSRHSNGSCEGEVEIPTVTATAVNFLPVSVQAVASPVFRMR